MQKHLEFEYLGIVALLSWFLLPYQNESQTYEVVDPGQVVEGIGPLSPCRWPDTACHIRGGGLAWRQLSGPGLPGSPERVADALDLCTPPHAAWYVSYPSEVWMNLLT